MTSPVQDAVIALIREAVRMAGSIDMLSQETRVGVAHLCAYVTAVAPIPDHHLTAIQDYLRRRWDGSDDSEPTLH